MLQASPCRDAALFRARSLSHSLTMCFMLHSAYRAYDSRPRLPFRKWCLVKLAHTHSICGMLHTPVTRSRQSIAGQLCVVIIVSQRHGARSGACVRVSAISIYATIYASTRACSRCLGAHITQVHHRIRLRSVLRGGVIVPLQSHTRVHARLWPCSNNNHNHNNNGKCAVAVRQR